jgi:hypothetical protein
MPAFSFLAQEKPTPRRRDFAAPKEVNMTNRTLTRCAATTGLAVALSLATVAAGSAAPRWGGHRGGGAAIGAGVAGFALGAAAATAASPYYNGYGYGGGYYDYAPDAVVAPGPYYGAAPYATAPAPDWSYGWRRRGDCRFSIQSC